LEQRTCSVLPSTHGRSQGAWSTGMRPVLPVLALVLFTFCVSSACVCVRVCVCICVCLYLCVSVSVFFCSALPLCLSCVVISFFVFAALLLLGLLCLLCFRWLSSLRRFGCQLNLYHLPPRPYTHAHARTHTAQERAGRSRRIPATIYSCCRISGELVGLTLRPS